MQVCTFALEYSVGLELHHDIQIARWAAVDARFTFSREANTIAIVNASWNFHGERFVLFYTASAGTGGARLRNNFASAMTSRAGLLNREKSLLHPYLALTIAGMAGLGRGSGLGTAAFAGLAILERRNANLGFSSARRLL